MYKFSNKEHTAVTNLTTGASGIHPGVWMWEQYQEWAKAGGVTEAFDTRTAAEIAAEEKAKEDAVIRSSGSTQLLALGNPYSPEERETWITQEAEARAWTANHSAVCPMITAMATTRGIPIALMVQKIIENADLFKGASGQILGAQQKALDLLGV